MGLSTLVYIHMCLPQFPLAIGTTNYTVTGAPLVLEFENFCLKAPEVDITFSAADLSRWANELWAEMQ